MTPGSGTVVDPRTSLAMWLRDGRARKKLSLDDVARITKIQPRILEKLEAGQLDGLPAEVFVKGFIRSFARCVGLDEAEALDRYTTCRNAPVARALVDSMSELAPVVARTTRPMEAVEAPVSEVSAVEAPEIVELGPIVSEVSILPPVEVSASELPVVEISVSDLPAIDSSAELVAQPAKKKRSRKKAGEAAADGAAPKRTRSRKKKVALGTPAEPTPVVAAPAEPVVEPAPISESSPAHAMELEVAAVVEAASGPVEAPIASEPVADTAEPVAAADTTAEPISDAVVNTTITAEGSGPTHGTWKPTMPPLAATASAPWRRPSLPAASVAPSLVIDDADPESAERERDEREAAKDGSRLFFLPPILLDREDRSARQGGLTLAVIILLIAATLTLSYLMRRPSVSGDGVTMRETPASLA